LFTIPAHRDDRLVTRGRAFMPIEMLTYAALAGRLNCSPEAAGVVARFAAVLLADFFAADFFVVLFAAATFFFPVIAFFVFFAMTVLPIVAADFPMHSG
jgi:hypothetical protein